MSDLDDVQPEVGSVSSPLEAPLARRYRLAFGVVAFLAATAASAMLVFMPGDSPEGISASVAASEQYGAAAVPVPPQDPAGAVICRENADGQECHDIGPIKAQALAEVLATGRPWQESEECPGLPAFFYQVTWLHPSGWLDPTAWSIPSAYCAPAYVRGMYFDLEQSVRPYVAGVWRDASLTATSETNTGQR